MKTGARTRCFGVAPVVAVLLLLLVRAAAADDDFLDTLDDHLKFGTADGTIAGRVSGLLDLEQYYVQQPAPGLLYTDHSLLFAPRLTLNLDVQLGPQLYLFAQARADRDYDPSSESNGQIRADQYALRYSPWEDGRVNVQVGKFATVVGSWARRHDSWDNPFITAPLPYENQGAIWDIAAAPSGGVLTAWTTTDKSLRLPIIWGADYASGATIFGTVGKFDYAAEIKNSSISARPDSWSVTTVGFDHPTYSGRVGFRPDAAWNLGVSGSVGTYLKPAAEGSLPARQSLDDYRQITLAEDAGFAWHHWQIWAECFETRFQVPTVGNADTLAYYIEAKYKFSPEFFAALRWNQQLFATVPNGAEGETAWGSDLGRMDAALTYRFTPHLQAKVQYSFLDQGAPVPERQHLVAGQLTMRF